MFLEILVESFKRLPSGLIEVSILLRKEKEAWRSYSYSLNCENKLKVVNRLLKQRKPGKALNFLKENNITIKED